MNESSQKQTLSSSSLRTMNKNESTLQHSGMKPIPNGNKSQASSNSRIQYRSPSTILCSPSARKSNSNSNLANGQSYEVSGVQQKPASSLVSGAVCNGSSNGKMLLSSTSLRKDNSVFFSNCAAQSAKFVVSSNGIGISPSTSEKPKVANNLTNGCSHNGEYRPNTNTSSLSSSSTGLRLKNNGSVDAATVVSNGKPNHINSFVLSSGSSSVGESVQASKSGSRVLTSISSIPPAGGLCNINLSDISPNDKDISSHQSLSTSEFSGCEADTPECEKLSHLNRDNSYSSLESDFNISVDMFAKTPAAKVVENIMTGAETKHFCTLETDSEDDLDIIVPATQQVVLSPDGLGPIQLDPGDIIIVMASDDEDGSFIDSSMHDHAEASMVIHTDCDGEIIQPVFLDEEARCQLGVEVVHNDKSTIIVPATQEYLANISDTEQLGPSIVPCSENEDEECLSQNTSISQLQKSEVGSQTRKETMNFTFTVSPYPMKIYSRVDREFMGQNRYELRGVGLPRLQLDPIEEMNVGDKLECGSANASSSDDTSDQPMDSPFVLNIPNSQTSSEQLNVTFDTTSVQSNFNSNSTVQKNVNNKSADHGKKNEDIREIINEDKPETADVGSQSSPAKATAVSTSSLPEEEADPAPSPTVQLAAAGMGVGAAASPRKGKKLYDIPVYTPSLKPIDPPKPIDTSDSEEESQSKTPIAASRCPKPKTYNKRGRDSKADREALYETENPRPSTSAALVRHNLRSQKMKTSSKVTRSDAVLKSNRLPMSRSRHDEFVLKFKPKPVLKIVKRMRKVQVISSSEDDSGDLQDLPDIDVDLPIQPQADGVEEPIDTEERKEDVNGKDKIIKLLSENELKEKSVSSGRGVATIDVCASVPVSTGHNQLLLPSLIPLYSAHSLSIVDLAVGHRTEAKEPTAVLENCEGNEKFEQCSQPPARQRGLRRNQNLDSSKKSIIKPTLAPSSTASSSSGSLENPKSQNPPENQVESSLTGFAHERLVEDGREKNNGACSPLSPAIKTSSIQNQSFVQKTGTEGSQGISLVHVITLLSESQSESQSKEPLTKQKENQKKIISCSQENGIKVGKPVIVGDLTEGKARSHNKNAVSENTCSERKGAGGRKKDSTVVQPPSTVKRVAFRSTSSLGDTETEPPGNVSKKWGKRRINFQTEKKGCVSSERENPTTNSTSRSKRARKQSEIDDQVVSTITNRSGGEVEVEIKESSPAKEEHKKPKRGRPPKKRKPEPVESVELEREQETLTKSPSNEHVKSSSLKKAIKGEDAANSRENPHSKANVQVVIKPEPEVPGPGGLRRSRRPRKERDLGDGMVPYLK